MVFKNPVPEMQTTLTAQGKSVAQKTEITTKEEVGGSQLGKKRDPGGQIMP